MLGGGEAGGKEGVGMPVVDHAEYLVANGGEFLAENQVIPIEVHKVEVEHLEIVHLRGLHVNKGIIDIMCTCPLHHLVNHNIGVVPLPLASPAYIAFFVCFKSPRKTIIDDRFRSHRKIIIDMYVVQFCKTTIDYVIQTNKAITVGVNKFKRHFTPHAGTVVALVTQEYL